MASTINASSSGGGGIIQTADASGVLNLQGGGNTGISISATGVPTLTTGSILNTPASVSLTNATNFLSVNDVTSYMASNTTIGVGTAALCNTGSIGANGQKWELTGVALMGTTDGTTSIHGLAIYNSTTGLWVANGGGVYYQGGAGNWPGCTIVRAVVTLTAANTFTLYGNGNQANFIAYSQGYGNGGLNTATFISARRLT